MLRQGTAGRDAANGVKPRTIDAFQADWLELASRSAANLTSPSGPASTR